MYAFLHGRLEEHGPPVVLDVGGVGFEVWVGEAQRQSLGSVGDRVRLFTHLQVREDDMTLYGFPSAAEREIFRALLGVNGVGPKVALAVLGDHSAQDVLRGIRRGDAQPLLAIKGIGRKTAERIVLELEDKAAAWLGVSADAAPAVPRSRHLAGVAGDVALGLEQMGETTDRAQGAVAAAVAECGEVGFGILMRAALRHLHPEN